MILEMLKKIIARAFLQEKRRNIQHIWTPRPVQK